MPRINSLEDLKKIQSELISGKRSIQALGIQEPIARVRVAMATCGIASGARNIMDYMVSELLKRNIPAEVTKTGDRKSVV